MTAGADLTPDLVLYAYAQGIFPMAESRDDANVFWVNPERRGIFPLTGFHVSRSLARTIRSGLFRVTFDRDFAGVMAGCADRVETWIGPTILSVYQDLHAMGRAHSVEVWEGDALVGGTYGVTLGSAWFGESMFSRVPDASKVALAYLVAHLRARAFRLFDTQFLTPHLASLGAVEIPRAVFQRQLRAAITAPADFAGPVPDAYSVAQLRTQTS
jgi:leucyl/phenylalanyl-tRNA---protein transferase